MDLDVFKITILSGIKKPCSEIDPLGQCSVADCLKCFNAKVAYKRIEEECKDGDGQVKDAFYLKYKKELLYEEI